MLTRNAYSLMPPNMSKYIRVLLLPLSLLRSKWGKGGGGIGVICGGVPRGVLDEELALERTKEKPCWGVV